jgi:DNA repair protein RadA/Sms
VTKDGELAGPRIEHMVDCVLHFEGQSDLQYRMMRAVKNRFGAVNELSVFEMTDQGLREVITQQRFFWIAMVRQSLVLLSWSVEMVYDHF